VDARREAQGHQGAGTPATGCDGRGALRRNPGLKRYDMILLLEEPNWGSS